MGTTSKLEEKLKELGYQLSYHHTIEKRKIYYKWANEIWRIAFELTKDTSETIIDITLGSVSLNLCNDKEKLQQAFNIMQRDLEELKNVESN